MKSFAVETKEQLDIIKALQCDAVQGFYYAKPMPAEEYEKMLFRDEKQALG